MDHAAHALAGAHLIYSRANSTSSATTDTRPPIYKAIGISLAIASGVFIGISFVFKKVGLLKANDKYNEVAGEGYGYLKNPYWWGGMTLMIIGEICNFVAYAFVDAILVTPMGALSVVITSILSAIFLKERLSIVGKIGCFLCIVGSVVIVMNAPAESSAANIQEMQNFVIAPGFLSYAGVIILVSIFLALWAGPRYGKKTMLVYISICSLIGGLSVVATQGLGAAIVAQIGGEEQYKHWFLYVLFVFVIATLVTEIIYLNKALNLFSAAVVTPTYYVMFTSSTILTSAILFRGFKGTPTSITTVVMGFFVICSGTVLLQLSKASKDVPDNVVFSGELDQLRTIAEQEQPETDPKADAIRGTAAIVRRFSETRKKREMDEARRLHEESQNLEPIGENEQIVWDGLRRRRTTYGTQHSARSQHSTSPFPVFDGAHIVHPRTPAQHPPLGMSHFPSDSDSDEENRPTTASTMSFFARARSIVDPRSRNNTHQGSPSPMYPVPLTEISVPITEDNDLSETPIYAHETRGGDDRYGLPSQYQKTEYSGAAGERHITIQANERLGSRGSLHPSVGPTPPPHSARRQFSFQNVFRKGPSTPTPPVDDHQASGSSILPHKGKKHGHTRNTSSVKGATEEERLGLVKGDTNTERNPSTIPSSFDKDDYSDEEWLGTDTASPERYQSESRDLTSPRQGDREKVVEPGSDASEEEYYAQQRRRFESGKPSPTGRPLPPPPDEDEEYRGDGSRGAFV